LTEDGGAPRRGGKAEGRRAKGVGAWRVGRHAH
jgi:hypothetical protein